MFLYLVIVACTSGYQFSNGCGDSVLMEAPENRIAVKQLMT